MGEFRQTLVCDGPTDANLIPIINWTLKEVGGVDLPDVQQAQLWKLPKPPENLSERICKAIEYYPCEVLFVHRDAERENRNVREDEIKAAVEEATTQGCKVPTVAIIPVRMLEAWLLFDEQAIRNAAGNPNGTTELPIPPMNRMESRPDPKSDLQQALRIASELTGRRLKKFNTSHAFWRIVDFIDDFSALRQLPAYLAFEDSVKHARRKRWSSGFYGTQSQ